MAKLTIVQAVADALRTEMELDERVVVLGEDVGVNGRVFRATEGLYERFGENRVIDTPLAESAIVGTAIGMAIYGLRPVAEIQFEGFMPPAFDQIVNHAARIRTRSRARFTCPLVIRAPWGGGIRAPEHHSDSPEAWFIHQPGLKVVIPSTPYDTKGLLIAAIRDPDPVIFFEPKRIYRAFRQEVPEEAYTVPIGRARTVREGRDIAIFTWGAMVRIVEEAAEELAGRGIECEVVDLRTLSPVDVDAIVAAVQKTGRALVVHEAPRTGGFGAEIVALINERALLYLEAPVLRVARFDTPMPLFHLEDYYLPNKQRVIKGVERVLNF